MKKTTYRDERISHLEKYAENRSMPIGGTYNNIPYKHILKLEHNDKRHVVSCYNIIKGVPSDLLPNSLHRFAHHLNSSQILCYNFFRPMLTSDARATEELVSLLKQYGIKIALGSKCTFEYNDGAGDGSEFDFHVQSGEVEVFFEVKYTEQGFGRANNDEKHQTKFDEIYKNNLFNKEECLLKKPDYQEFINKYQLYRNAIRVTDKNKFLVLLYPKANEIVHKQATEFIGDKINNTYKDNVKALHWEDVITDKECELYCKYLG